MGKFLIIILLLFSCYGAYINFFKNDGSKIPENRLTKKQKEERNTNKQLARFENKLDDVPSDDSKKMVPPQIIEFVNNTMEQWTQLTLGEKNELKHLSGRIDQRLPFGNYEKTLLKKLSERNVFEAIRQNNPGLIQNTNNIIQETNSYQNDLPPQEDPAPVDSPAEDIPSEPVDEPSTEEIPEEQPVVEEVDQPIEENFRDVNEPESNDQSAEENFQ